MKIKIVRQVCFSVAVLLVLTTAACSYGHNSSGNIDTGSQNSKQIEQQGQDEENSVAVEGSSFGTDSTEKEKSKPAPVASIELPIYTINQDNQEVESVVALVPENSKLTPELIVDLVVDSFADRLITVGIDKVTTEGDMVIVSFLNDQAPLINVGSGVETTILDAIAQSLVDNLKEEYPKVVFRAEGKKYSSGHYSFGLNEVYLTGSKIK